MVFTKFHKNFIYTDKENQGSKTKKAVHLGGFFVTIVFRLLSVLFGRLGSDLLSRALRRSTISATCFHGRVRDGIGCLPRAITTKPSKENRDYLH